MRRDPGSYRDPTSGVFTSGGRILRGVRGTAAADLKALMDTDLWASLARAGHVVDTNVSDESLVDFELVLEHERIPFVSYPYEWPFSMLKRAALLQLEILRESLREDYILKDATPYNVQWVGARPTLIDVGSFQRLAPGDAWIGYRQFCRLFLFPLMLRAYLDVPFRQWLRGDLEGLPAGVLWRLLGWRQRLRIPVLTHVGLQARAERAYEDAAVDVRAEIQAAGFKKELIEANVNRLHRLVSALSWKQSGSGWSDYAAQHPHVADDRSAKADFVKAALRDLSPRTVWDVGTNDGYFARLAADAGAFVVAMDSDEVSVDRLYRDLSAEDVENILPLVIDLANPSPAQGWRGEERQSLDARGRPDLVLCLAVAHHLAISNHIPLASVLDWLAAVAPHAVIEWVEPDDPMVMRLSRNRRPEEVHEYESKLFEQLLSERFEVVDCRPLPSGTRSLYLASAR